jgi:hypothetical protein
MNCELNDCDRNVLFFTHFICRNRQLADLDRDLATERRLYVVAVATGNDIRIDAIRANMALIREEKVRIERLEIAGAGAGIINLCCFCLTFCSLLMLLSLDSGAGAGGNTLWS